MKKLVLGLFLSVNLAVLATLQAGLSDVQILVNKTGGKTEKGEVKGEGSTAKDAVQVGYDIKLTCSAPKDLADLTVDYIMFVERQRISTKKEADIVERITGTLPVPVLTRKEPQTVTTKDVQLAKSSLVGNYIYSDGGRIKVEDSIKGIWVRVSQGGKLVAEYLNPSTVKNRGWEQK